MNIDDYTPEDAQNELMGLLIKAARRCAYDLRHAAGDVRDETLSDRYLQRANMWIKIFDPADGLKDYRHRLHHEILDLENRVQSLENLCKENNIDCRDPNAPPF